MADWRPASEAGRLMLNPLVKRLLRKILYWLPEPAQRLAISLYQSHFVFALDALGSVRRAGEYRRWVRLYDTLSVADRAAILKDIEGFTNRPLISVVVPVFDAPERHLRAALDSVLHQFYPNWELCIADDASTAPHVAPVLSEYAARDRRVSVV